MAKRLTHEELERDEVAESLQETLEAFRRHRHLIIGAVLAVILAMVIVLAIRSHRERVLAESNRMLQEAINKHAQWMEATTPAERSTAATEMQAQLQNLADSYPGTPLGVEALYLLGNLQYRQDQFEPAREMYNRYLQESENPEQRARGEIGLAYAYENEAFLLPTVESEQPDPAAAQRGMLQEALTHFEKAATEVPDDSYLEAYALFGQARIHELLLDDARAIELYQRVMERPAPVPSRESDAAPEQQNSMMDFIRRELESRQGLLSLSDSARLRLERLQADTDAATPAASAPSPAATAQPEATPQPNP